MATGREFGSWRLPELKEKLWRRKAKKSGKKADLEKRYVGDNRDTHI